MAKVNWDELLPASTDAIREALNGAPDDLTFRKAKLGMGVLNAYTREQATESAQKQLGFMAARYLAKDDDEFRAYISASLPDVSLPKLRVGHAKRG